jgi:hypothetical protein
MQIARYQMIKKLCGRAGATDILGHISINLKEHATP